VGNFKTNPKKNFDLNRRFALSGLLSMNFNVHMGNLGSGMKRPLPDF
jgi:hypothetical protein